MYSLNLTQHVSLPTHSLGHTLDLVITASDSTLQPSVSCSPLSPSDHLPIFTALDIDQLPVLPPPAQRSFRRLAAINTENFTSDISHSVLITNPPSSLPELLECYNKTLSSILDKHAPLITKPARSNFNPWYTPALRTIKCACRTAENLWKRTRCPQDWLFLKTTIRHYHDAIKTAKQQYYSARIASSLGNPRRLWSTVNNVLHRKQSSPLPTSTPSLPALFASFFIDKITSLRDTIKSSHATLDPHDPPPTSPPAGLFSFKPVTLQEVEKLLAQSPDKHCDLDPLPTSLLKKCSSVLLPTITNIMNLSLSEGTFPDLFKVSQVTPLLKKPSLDKEILSNYRPISNLSFLSKLAEKIVKKIVWSNIYHRTPC